KWLTPDPSESLIRILVRTAHGAIRRERAQTGAPAKAMTAARPIARRNVLLPDMLEPVTNRAVPARDSATSLETRCSGLIRTCPKASASKQTPVGKISGKQEPGSS